jgi:hypothetical protein
MCHALIAEHMFTPNLDTYTGDDGIIDKFTPRRFGPICAVENGGKHNVVGSKEG